MWRDGELVGGLYGLRIGGLFAGESMFHRVTDASKVACWATVELLRLDGAQLFDVQWTTPHLRTLGAVDVAAAPSTCVGSPAGARAVAFDVHELTMTVFHNQACSKSRGALAILDERGVELRRRAYLDTPPDRATLERILDAISDEPRRSCAPTTTSSRRSASPKADVTTREQVIDVLLAHPEVMQRPVVFVGDRAVIARPSEKVLDLLD